VSRYSDPEGARRVYVATGRDFPDALVAGPAAAKERAPILLVTRDTVPHTTAAELRRLNPEVVIVLGGPAAISDRTAARVGELATATVRRLP
jgi:putative cell wall-binding protein